MAAWSSPLEDSKRSSPSPYLLTVSQLVNGLVKESPITTRIHEKIQAAKAKASRDFRSDVVTVPVEEMMEAILAASVNDDIYDAEGNPSVKALEAKMVELTGMEAALWAVSGTQGNQICLRTHLTQPPHSVLYCRLRSFIPSFRGLTTCCHASRRGPSNR
ncbi:Uncharacterized protein HZ326_15277 [Fusarium oxysporum f. sp. albedinis]|nr:Uncharacterized protein HZ326_15277 [Fusarium oxysporum f. sp. albedinis]